MGNGFPAEPEALEIGRRHFLACQNLFIILQILLEKLRGI